MGVSREYGDILYRDYTGIMFPYSLLTTTKPIGLGSLCSLRYACPDWRVLNSAYRSTAMCRTAPL